jgi:anti-anti-sigma factor
MASIDQVVVTVFARPGEAVVCLRMAGEVDMAAEPALAHAVARLHAFAPSTVVIDLAAVTFACSTLANFVVRVRNAIPDDASLLLCRPTTAIRRLLKLTALDGFVALDDDLPPWWDGGTPTPDAPQPCGVTGLNPM